ncbi:MAG: hypothetical protein WBH08_03840 [Methanothrix sp.]|uniref:hypothetical protein n=1 Tax=Methanothrix sp. TaxID=90426 RepID=UPI003BB74AE0
MAYENVRDFIVRTLFKDEAGKGLDDLLAKAVALTEKSYSMTMNVATAQAEKAIKNIEAAGKKAADIDTAKATRGLKEQDRATGGLNERMKTFAEQSMKASTGIGSFFSKLDAGRLIAASSAAGVAYFAKHVVEVYENVKLYTDLIQAKVGTATGLMSFIESGGAESGTSRLGRAAAAGYLAMTGWAGGDQSQIETLAASAEKIMRRTQEGQYLKTLGITDETALLKALSEQIDPTSDLGKTLAPLAPELFQQSAVEREKMLVMREPKYANIINTQYGQSVAEQEARRRIAARAIESISEKAAPRTDVFNLAMEDMGESSRNLREKVGKYIEPAVLTITKLVDSAIDLASRSPEVTAFALALVSVGTILPVVALGVKALTAAMMANPIGLAITAVALLAVGLIALEYKFGIFTKAWEHFAQSEIGKDLIAGVNDLLKSLGLFDSDDFMGGLEDAIERVTSRVSALFDKLDAVYKLVKPLLGGGENENASFEGFKNYVQTATKGSENYKSFTQTSDEVLQAAYTEAQTGISQPHPYIDEYEYKRLVEAAYPEYLKHGTPPAPAKSPIDTISNAAGKAVEIAEQVGFGEGDAMQFAINPVGYLGGKYWDSATSAVGEGNAIQFMIDPVGAILRPIADDKHATGGEVTKSGIAWVDEGEPIVPAEVARDSNLIDLLRGASEGGGGAGDINVYLGGISVQAGAGADGYSLGRQIKEALDRELSSFEFKSRVEQTVHRATRGYIG